MSGVSYLPPESGDVLGIGTGIIRTGGRGGKLLEVAPAHAVTAFRVGAAVGDGPVAEGAADSLLAPTRFDGSFAGVQLGVEIGLRDSNELLEQGGAGGGSLLGAVVAQRVGLVLRFENEGSEPGQRAGWQIETERPRVGHPATSRAAS